MKKWSGIIWLVVIAALWAPALANAQGSASIKIVKPGDRRNVALGEGTVTVEITGAALADGYAWALWLDGVRVGGPYRETAAKINMDKPTGPRRIKAVLYDPQNNEIASNEILVIAAPVETNTDVFNRSWFVPFMIVFTLGIIGIILLGLRMRPRSAA